jgi:hypothetical protein
MISLASLDEIKAYPGMNTASQQDTTWITILIQAFSQLVETRTNRKLEYKSWTEYASPPPCSRFIQLAAFGTSSGSITSVSEDLDGVFGVDTVLDPGDYGYDPETGMLFRRYTFWMPGHRSVKVVHTGGLMSATEDVPADLKMACIMQVAFWYQRRNELGITQRTQAGGAITVQGTSKILPEVEEIINNYTLHQIAGGVITDYSGFV